MGRKRKATPSNIIQLDFFDHMLDCVTLGTKEITVEQAGSWPPYAMVVSSRVWPRDPRTQMERLERMERAMRKSFEVSNAQPGMKYCINCGEWRLLSRFSPDHRNNDGLHSWCKYCRAEHARGVYIVRKGRELQAA